MFKKGCNKEQTKYIGTAGKSPALGFVACTYLKAISLKNFFQRRSFSKKSNELL